MAGDPRDTVPRHLLGSRAHLFLKDGLAARGGNGEKNEACDRECAGRLLKPTEP